MWCMHNFDKCKVGNKQAANRKTHRKISSGSSTREQAMDAMINIVGNNDDSCDEEWLIRSTCKVPFWFLLTFLASTLVYVHTYLFHQLLFLPEEISIIIINYLNLIRLIDVSFFGLFDCVLLGWDPGPDTYTPSLLRILCRCSNHYPQDHHWNRCQKRYNHQWARR